MLAVCFSYKLNCCLGASQCFSDQPGFTMKSYLLILALVACAHCQGRIRPVPQTPGQIVNIIKETNEVNIDGSYQWSFEADNGISAQESGQQKNANSQDPVEEAQGSYRYTAPDGTDIQMTYVANEGGFQPQGAHIPVPPPIPVEIQRALEWNAAHPEEEDGGTPPRRP